MLNITYVGLLVVTRCTCVRYTFKSDCNALHFGYVIEYTYIHKLANVATVSLVRYELRHHV